MAALPPLPRRVLVANRGEIAVRVARTCRAMGVGIVTVHAPNDTTSSHRLAGDRDVEVPSYLDGGALIDAARRSGCDAVHPGYGFLSENAAFASDVVAAGLTWIGPPASAMEVMATKTGARAAMERAGVPVVPGSAAAAPERLVGPAAGLGYPVLVKPSAGGGGKGMARVDRPSDLVRAAQLASDQARQAFGDGSVYLEKLIERPRHVEIQVFADDAGNVVALGERECSIQRRHQKIVEETPSPAVSDDLRKRMEDAAVAAARAVSYRSAGTVEFLLAKDGSFFFLEMNTRLQVEHPVTEWVTGLDLVALQLEVAAGRPLPAQAHDARRRGHAIEARVYAEDPAMGHLPQAGRILLLREPQGPGIRVDAALEGGEVSVHYDPLLAKVACFGRDREEARRRLVEALSRFVVLGIRTNLSYLRDVLEHERFVAGDLSTSFLDDHFASWREEAPGDVVLAASTLASASASSQGRGAAGPRPDPWARLGGLRLGSAP